MKRYSKSKFLLYDFCPRAYKYGQIDKVITPIPEVMITGKRLHSVFEKFYDRINIGLQDVELKNNFIRAAKSLSKEVKLEYSDANISQLKNFVNFNLRLHKKISITSNSTMIPIEREWKKYNEEEDFVGIVDAIFEHKGNILVLDYKTGKYNEAYVKNYRFELALYADLWDKFRPELPSTHWGIYFSKVDYLWKEKVSDKYREDARKKAKQIIKNIEKEKFNPKKDPPCFICQYYFHCDKRVKRND